MLCYSDCEQEVVVWYMKDSENNLSDFYEFWLENDVKSDLKW